MYTDIVFGLNNGVLFIKVSCLSRCPVYQRVPFIKVPLYQGVLLRGIPTLSLYSEPLYSGPLVKQPPHYYSHLLRSIMAHISISTTSLLATSLLWPIGNHYREVSLYIHVRTCTYLHSSVHMRGK